MTVLLLVGAFAFALALALTLVVEHGAATWGLLQKPNARSSHVRPTPSSGGVGIAAGGVIVCLDLALVNGSHFIVLAALSLAIAALGLLDDLRDLSPMVRFPVQIGLVIALLATSPTLPALPLGGGLAIGGSLLTVAMLIGGLWWINLFNFMDGIDGIAASQAMLILLGAAALWTAHIGALPNDPDFILMIAVAAACLGFLLRNWAPAHIFMGDSGSNFLAFVILAVALTTLANGAINYFSWLALILPFAIDASMTLVRRLARGERPWQAHRRHGYQQLSRRWGHHRATLLYCALSLLWALPRAFAAAYWPGLGWAIVLVTALPLVVLAIWSGAGEATERPI